MPVPVRRCVGMMGLLVAVLAGLAGCASEYRLPPNSLPLDQVQDGRFPDYSKILLGTWVQAGVIDTTAGITILPNVIDRQAELSGIKEWKTFQFTPDGRLILRNNKITETLIWAVDRNQLTLHLRGATEADRWQINVAGDSLFLRSLTDSDTYTLKRSS